MGGVATAHDAAPLTGAQPTLVQPATDRFHPSSPPLTATAVHAATPVGSAAPAIDETRANSGVNIAFGILASLAGLAVIIGSFLPMLTIRTDSSVPSGDFDLNDIFGGSNLQIAFVIAGVALIAGAVISNFRYRFGAGLSGGTALVLIPYLAYVWGLTRIVSDHAQASAVASGQGTFIETTTGVGFFVLAAAVVLGFVAMLVGLAFAGYDTLPPLNRLICMGGALGGIAAGVGQLIPGSGASLSDNFDTGFMGSAWIVYSRLGIMGAIIVATMVGFLRCNRWGVGFAIGSIVIYVWQWISSVADWGTQPLPPAFGNPGGDLKPTAVTTIGLVAVIGFGALALLVGGRREPLVQPTTVMMPDYRQSA